MSANSSPTINNFEFVLQCSNPVPSSLGLCLVSNLSNPGGDPYSIGVVTLVDIVFATEVYALDMFSDGLGNTAAFAPIPNNPLLIGSVYFAQTLWAWTFQCTASTPYNLSSSDRLTLTIQS
jgi:hypothetical protein